MTSGEEVKTTADGRGDRLRMSVSSWSGQWPGMGEASADTRAGGVDLSMPLVHRVFG
jgi:hypothetical protein